MALLSAKNRICLFLVGLITVSLTIMACIWTLYTYGLFNIGQALRDLSDYLKSTSYYSRPLLALALCICSLPVPPITLFIFLISMTGFTFEFPAGGLIATTGTFFGALLAYVFVKTFFQESDNQKIQALSAVIGQEGLKMVVLFRFTPLPWQIQNLVLALCHTVSFKMYFVGACVASLKINIDIWFASQFASETKSLLPAAAMFVVTTAITLWVVRTTKKKMKEYTEMREQEELIGSHNDRAQKPYVFLTTKVPK